MDKLVHPYSKKEWTVDTHNNLNESQRHYVAWKKLAANGCILYASIYMTFSKDKAIVMENRSVGAKSYGSGKGVAIKG